MKNNWSCFPTALALLLDIPVSDIINEIGHDGSEIIWPKLKDPHRRRGFHVQEIALVALNHGYALGTYEIAPACAPSFEEMPFILRGMGEVVVDLMTKYPGLLLGYGKAKTHHAVAWDMVECIDPNGTRYTIDQFSPTAFLPLMKL